MMAEGGRAFSDDRQVGNGGTSNTVEVRGFSANINKELLEMYFENSRRSGGGDTEEVQIGAGIAYITFTEAEVAQRVVSRSNHKVDGQTLAVALFHPLPPKPCYENRFLIQGLNNAITEEMLTNVLETVTEAKVREFLYGEEEGKVVVTLSNNINVAQLRKIFRERSIERAFLQVTRVDISNCIIVQNIQPSTSHDVLLFYFENKRRSGGGDVERVEIKAEEGFCLVYFEDLSVIDRVLSQTHNIDATDVEVHLHHECLGRRSSRNRFDPYLRICCPGPTDSAILEEENIDNKAKDKSSSSVSSNPEKESDFVEVSEWQENDGKNCTLTLWIKYKRAPDMKIVKDMKKVPCSWNFHLYWNFYTKTKKGQHMLHEIISKYNCSVAVCSDEEDLFIFEISAKNFEQEPDMVHFIHDVLDNIYKSAQQFLYFDIILVEQRMQGDILQLMKQRRELDGTRIELMRQQDHDTICVVCTEKDKLSVIHVVTEIIHNVKECFENHEETISVDHNWQKVMKTFEYIQCLCDKFPKVTILLDETKPAIMLKGPRDQSKAAADHLMELVETAKSEVKEDIFSPSCQFEIFTYPEMCDYINNIVMEISVVWIPNQLTKKIHLFSKKLDKIKGIDKTIKGCVQERAYPLQRDQSVHSPEICNFLETLKKKHTGKIVVNPSARGLLVTTADDIFESVDAAVQEIISKHTGLPKNLPDISRKYRDKLDLDQESEYSTNSTGIEDPMTFAEEKERYLVPMTEMQKGRIERKEEELSQEDTDSIAICKIAALTSKQKEENNVQHIETTHEDKVNKFVSTKDINSLDRQIAISAQNGTFGAKSRKKNAVGKSKAEGDTAIPPECHIDFGQQVPIITYQERVNRTSILRNEQKPEGNKNDNGMKVVTVSEDDTAVSGTSTKGKEQGPNKTKDEEYVANATGSIILENFDAQDDTALTSLDDDVSEESATEDDDEGNLMKFTVTIFSGKECDSIIAPEGENALKWRFLFDCPHTQKELKKDPVMVGIKFKYKKGNSPFIEVTKSIKGLKKKVETVLQTHAEQIQIYHIVIPDVAVEIFFETLRLVELFKTMMIIAYKGKTDLCICGKKEHMEKAIQHLEHTKEYVLRLILKTEAILMKDAPLQLMKRWMEVNVSADTSNIQYEFKEDQNSLHITGLESEIIKEREKLKDLLGCITRRYIPRKCAQFSIFEELEIVKYIEGILQEQKLVCTWKTCREDCRIVVTAFDEETCEKACKVIDAACVTETIPLQIDAVTMVLLGYSWEQELSSICTKHNVGICINKIDKVHFLIIGKDFNIQLAQEELERECSLILKKTIKSAEPCNNLEYFYISESNNSELIVLKDKCCCHFIRNDQLYLKNAWSGTEIVEIIPVFSLNASRPDEVKADVVLSFDISKRSVMFLCPKWDVGLSKEKHILDIVLCHLYEFLISLGVEALLEIQDERIGNWPVGKFVKVLLTTFEKRVRTRPLVPCFFLLMKDAKVYCIVRKTVFDFYCGDQLHNKYKKENPRKEDHTLMLKPSKAPSCIQAIQVFVIKDQMTRRMDDVLVNTTDKSLNLSHGKVSQSILKAAGEDIQTECRKHYPNGIKPGQVAVTRAYRLQNSKLVFHGAFEMWNFQNEEALKRTLREFVTGCLQKADEYKMKTIAFPAIGTGNLGYPHKVVADCMFEAVEKYSQTRRSTYIEGVFFVIYFQDSANINAFVERLKVPKRVIEGLPVDLLLPSSSKGSQKQREGQNQ